MFYLCLIKSPALVKYEALFATFGEKLLKIYQKWLFLQNVASFDQTELFAEVLCKTAQHGT